MDQDNGVFSYLARRMDWLGQRQSLIAKNIANADTPNYRPQDLKEGQFRRAMMREAGGGMTPSRTAPGHMGGVNGTTAVRAADKRDLYEASPSGNAVILEQELVAMGRTQAQHELMISLYKKYVTMVKSAIGGRR